MSRRSYSDDDKGAALAALDANAGCVKATAAALEIPRATLTDWRDGRGVSPEVATSHEQKRLELADKFGDVALRCIESITGEKLEKAGLKDTLIAAGIAAEKQQLLRGDATTIPGRTNADLYLALVDKLLAAAQERGETLDRQAVVERVCERKPEARKYLLSEP